MAQKPPKGKSAGSVTDEALRVFVGIDLRDLYSGLETETARLLSEFAQRGLSGEALGNAVADELKSIGTAALERAGRESTHKGFVLGRNLEAQARPEEIGEVIRTAVLDENTCTEEDYGDGKPRCRELDGAVRQFNSPEYFEVMPPAGCEGGAQCRCFDMFRKKAA